MTDRIASIITKYQLKRVALLIFMMWLTWEVYGWVMSMMEQGRLDEWMAAAVLSPLSVLFPAVLKYMQEES